MSNNIFEADTVNQENILNGIIAEFKAIQISTLGGKDRASIILHVSMDKKENWSMNIFQNSRYYILAIDISGTVENYSRGINTLPIRKKTCKSLAEAILYINKQLAKNDI